MIWLQTTNMSILCPNNKENVNFACDIREKSGLRNGVKCIISQIIVSRFDKESLNQFQFYLCLTDKITAHSALVYIESIAIFASKHLL